MQGFDLASLFMNMLIQIDNIITLIFLFELITKINSYGLKRFLKSNWNVFDAILIVLALPSLYLWIFNGNTSQLDYLLVLRISRIFKFFRIVRFFPNIDHLVLGVQRALKASVIVLLGFLIYNFVISVLSCFFYRNIAPDYFANPLIKVIVLNTWKFHEKLFMIK
jgi:voltage-gated sodium channel